MNRRLCFLLLALAVAAPALASHEENSDSSEYDLGHGWQVPDTGLRLGGYAGIEIENDKHQTWTMGINDLSLFVTWEGNGKLKLFTELDLEDPLTFDHNSHLSSKHAYIGLERAYADYLYSETINLRVGKFLTPIGNWNLIHANPLIWTSSRPLITEDSFPTNATGIMVYGNLPILGRDIDYSVYTALSNDWRTDPKVNPFKNAYGLHVKLPATQAGEFGISYARFEQEEPAGVPEGLTEREQKSLIGLDYFWTHNRYEVSAELIYRHAENADISEEKGLFIQGVIPLSERWYAIGRYEWYNQVGPAPAMQLGLIGVAMRVTPAMVFKAEFSSAANNRIQAQEGLFTSFSVLF